MKTDAPITSSVSHGEGHDTNLVIFATIADTSWRMFVPVLLGAACGYGFDLIVGSRPIAVIAGTVLGVIVAILLVVQQYRRAGGRS